MSIAGLSGVPTLQITCATDIIITCRNHLIQVTTATVCMHRSSRVCNLLEVQLIIVHFIGRRTAAQLLLHSICVITAAQPYSAFDVASE